MTISTEKYKLALKVATTAAPILLALLAGYVYDLRPIVHDVCESLLPFGSMVQPGIPAAPEMTPDAGQ